ncbi:helix-turn-helix transcriptional regulator [Rhodocytophaga rosea]|uniref:Helix-turn-helix transcriptional regulator n=1 Tax=Rhodocytophaga rosea TaxID=2704465 RepID=A0A6C0GGR0_9BACT|nr:AraC family transcriptional regulator [Rhodocytophaga rosea]QHT67196.1 helix-turn-helix transcriptional regulator [Rhodocytophaga rosea]
MKNTSVDEFYKEIAAHIPDEISKEIGHFNVFKYEDVLARLKVKPVMPYNRRTYYKISLISGEYTLEYADKAVEIGTQTLLFATPKIPYHYNPKGENQSGYFCIFTEDFLTKTKSGIKLDELPIFKPGNFPVFQIRDEDWKEMQAIFMKMYREISSDYVYKYDLLRNYVLELIHYGQKLQPATALYTTHTASARIASLFIELLERQFPIESPQQKLSLRTAADYANRLAVHVNHLNKVLKENTGKTTTEIIASRIIQEAKILLKQTDWNISQIADSLGFEEVAHFSNFFRKQTSLAPITFRS